MYHWRTSSLRMSLPTLRYIAAHTNYCLARVLLTLSSHLLISSSVVDKSIRSSTRQTVRHGARYTALRVSEVCIPDGVQPSSDTQPRAPSSMEDMNSSRSTTRISLARKTPASIRRPSTLQPAPQQRSSPTSPCAPSRPSRSACRPRCPPSHRVRSVESAPSLPRRDSEVCTRVYILSGVARSRTP